MFERYTENARRVIFFARYEASQQGDRYIRCLHLLLGIAREVPQLLEHLGLTRAEVQKLGEKERHTPLGASRISTAIEVPLDNHAKRALVLAAEAADKSKSRLVMPQHLLWGIFYADPQLKKQLEQFEVTEKKLADLCQALLVETKVPVSYRDVIPYGMGSITTRSGIGYDLHRLEPGRKLMLGGIEVPFDRGSVGHSDGDVLSHAICDALLGAAGLGDIGTHFPDTDPKWKGASSLVFLEHIRGLLEKCDLQIVHIDAVVIAERPKLGPHFPAMSAALAAALGVSPEQINLKAKTNEGIGELGRSEAIAAHAIATVGP